MFFRTNRKKGINKGLFDFGDMVVFVNQEGPGRPGTLQGCQRQVVGALDVNDDNGNFTLSQTSQDWVADLGVNITVKLRGSLYAPVVTGDLVLVKKEFQAFQSSTLGTAGAELVIDGNLQSRLGSFTSVEANPFLGVDV